jgi:hypothetical protein
MSDIRNENIKLLMRDISRLSKENAALKAVVEKFTSTNNARDEILLCVFGWPCNYKSIDKCCKMHTFCIMQRETSPVA